MCLRVTRLAAFTAAAFFKLESSELLPKVLKHKNNKSTLLII